MNQVNIDHLSNFPHLLPKIIAFWFHFAENHKIANLPANLPLFIKNIDLSNSEPENQIKPFISLAVLRQRVYNELAAPQPSQKSKQWRMIEVFGSNGLTRPGIQDPAKAAPNPPVGEGPSQNGGPTFYFINYYYYYYFKSWYCRSVLVFFAICRTKLKRIVNLKLHNILKIRSRCTSMSVLLHYNFIYDVIESQSLCLCRKTTR